MDLTSVKSDGALGLYGEGVALSGPSISSTVAATPSSSGLKVQASQPQKPSPLAGALSSDAKFFFEGVRVCGGC